MQCYRKNFNFLNSNQSIQFKNAQNIDSKDEELKNTSNQNTSEVMGISSKAMTSIGRAFISFQAKETISDEEFIEIFNDKTLTTKEKWAKTGLPKTTYANRAQRLGLKSEVQLRLEEINSVTDEEFIEIFNDPNLSTAEKMKKTKTTRGSYQKRLARLGLQTERQKKLEEIFSLSEEEFTKIFYDDNLSEKEKWAKAGVSASCYRKMAAKYGLKTKKQKLLEERGKISDKEFTVIFEDDSLSISEKLEKTGYSSASFYNHAAKLGLKTAAQENRKFISKITEEMFLEVHNDKTLTLAQKCSKLGITRTIYLKKLRKLGLKSEYQTRIERLNSISDEEFTRIYSDSDLSTKDKCVKLGMSAHSLLSRAEKLGLKKRKVDSISDSEFIEIFNDKTLSKKEKVKKSGLGEDGYRVKVAQLGLKSEIQKSKDLNRSITDEEIIEVFKDITLSTSEKAKKLGLRKETFQRRAEGLGLFTDFQEKLDAVNNISEDEFIQVFYDKTLSEKEKQQRFNLSPSSYIKMANFLGLKTDRQIVYEEAQNLSDKEFLTIFNDYTLTPREKWAKAGLSNTAYYIRMAKLGLQTPLQKSINEASKISKESLVEVLAQESNVTNVCEKLNISYLRYYRLCHQYGIPVEMPKIQKDKIYTLKLYEQFSLDDLKYRLAEIYIGNENIADDSVISEAISYIDSMKNISKNERHTIIKFVRLLDAISEGKKEIDAVSNQPVLEDIYAWITKDNEISDNYETVLTTLNNKICEYFSVDKSYISEICQKYLPESIEDFKNVDRATELLNIFEISNDVTLPQMIVAFDAEQQSPNSEILKVAKDYSKKLYGEVRLDKVGQFIIANQIFNGDMTFANLENDAIQFVELFQDLKLSKRDSIDKFIQLEDYFNSDIAKNNSLTSFCEELKPNNNVINKSIINKYIESIYLDKTTEYCNISESNHFRGMPITVKICPEAKKTLWNYKCNFDKYEFLMYSDKAAQGFATAKFNSQGLKYFQLDRNYKNFGFSSGDYVAEIKINGADGSRFAAKRIDAADRTFEFKYFIPKGFH